MAIVASWQMQTGEWEGCILPTSRNCDVT